MRRDPCRTCGARTVYVGKYDRFACLSCKVWTDEPCGCEEGSCSFPKSPEQPSDEDLARAEKL